MHSKKKYTKADLEALIARQLESLNAKHNLLRIMKFQNELLESADKELSIEISEFKEHHSRRSSRRRNTKHTCPVRGSRGK